MKLYLIHKESPETIEILFVVNDGTREEKKLPKWFLDEHKEELAEYEKLGLQQKANAKIQTERLKKLKEEFLQRAPEEMPEYFL